MPEGNTGFGSLGNLAVAPGYNYHWHDNTKRYELYRLDELAGWEEDGDHPLGMLPSETELLQQTLDSPNSYRSYLTDYSHRGSLYAQWGGGRGHREMAPGGLWKLAFRSCTYGKR